MPTTLGRSYDRYWLGKPPHMKGEDLPLWHKFLNDYGALFEKVYYNVLLGGPFLSPEEKKDKLKLMWRQNISKRADVVAELKDEVWIIEVDMHPGMRALGQLMTYRHLWTEDTPISKPEKLVLLASVVDQDLISSAGRYQVQVFIIPINKL